MGHLEMIGTIVHQLTRNLTQEQLRDGGFAPYFIDHSAGVYPTAASGSPWNAAGIGVKGDVIFHPVSDISQVIEIAFPNEDSKRLERSILRTLEEERKRREERSRERSMEPQQPHEKAVLWQ